MSQKRPSVRKATRPNPAVGPSRPTRTVVIGDIHHRTSAVDRILSKFRGKYDQVVFLGDYFDCFGDTPDLMRSTLEWLSESVGFRNRVHLLGNHDLSYFFPRHPQAWCPGWSDAKQAVLEGYRGALPLERFSLGVQCGPWLVSHAGMHPGLVPAGCDAAAIEALLAGAKRDLTAGRSSPLFEAGRARGGDADFGGIAWLDFAREFQPIPGIHQLVGHTPAQGVARGVHLAADGSSVRSEHYDIGVTIGSIQQPSHSRSANYCLDCELSMVALLEPSGIRFVATGIE